MFGYIKVDKPECKIREYEYYRAVYCGLCRSLGRCTGQCSRMMLSYDMTFMALVRLSLSGITPTFGKSRCIAHPFRRRVMALPPKGSTEEEVFAVCACATVVLSYHKIRDDIADERGSRRLRARLARPFAGMLRRRASKRYAALDALVREGLARLSELEKSDSRSIDAPAEAFGWILSEILSFGMEGANQRIASEIGFRVGKWIYLVDAVDDFEEDVRKKRYNPLIRAYGETLDSAARESLLVALTAELMEAERGFDLIDYPDGDMQAIVENIIYLGMPQMARRVILPCDETRKESKHDRSL